MLQASKHDPAADHWGNLSRLASRAFASRFELDVAAAASRGELPILDSEAFVAARVICPAMQTFTAIRTMCSAARPTSSDSAPLDPDIESGGRCLVSVCISLSCSLPLTFVLQEIGDKRRRLDKRKMVAAVSTFGTIEAGTLATCGTIDASPATQECVRTACESGATAPSADAAE